MQAGTGACIDENYDKEGYSANALYQTRTRLLLQEQGNSTRNLHSRVLTLNNVYIHLKA